jgi:hypothetical protein
MTKLTKNFILMFIINLILLNASYSQNSAENFTKIETSNDSIQKESPYKILKLTSYDQENEKVKKLIHLIAEFDFPFVLSSLTRSQKYFINLDSYIKSLNLTFQLHQKISLKSKMGADCMELLNLNPTQPMHQSILAYDLKIMHDMFHFQYTYMLDSLLEFFEFKLKQMPKKELKNILGKLNDEIRKNYEIRFKNIFTRIELAKADLSFLLNLETLILNNEIKNDWIPKTSKEPLFPSTPMN